MGNRLNKNFFKKIFNFFLDCVSFNTPQAIVFNISFIFLTLVVVPTNYLTYLPTRCIFKELILPLVFGGNCPTKGFFANCECPACGLTRALSSLLHGDFHSSLNYNPLVIPVFLVMSFLLIFNIVKMLKK